MDETINIRKWLSFIWSKRRIIVVIEIVFIITGVIYSLILPKKYEAVSVLLPSQTASPSSNIISQLSNYVGENLFSSGETFVDLYPKIVTSRSILTDVLKAPYNGGTFEQALTNEVNVTDERRENLLLSLRKNIINVTVDNRTKAVTIVTSTHSPELSAALNNEILNQLENFFRFRMKNIASSQRLMIEDRLEDIADSLRLAEENLLEFNNRNRDIRSSPTLKITELRLSRQVQIYSTTYIELTSQLEIVKINELQYKPILNILDHAVAPFDRSSPHRKKIVMMFLISGFAASIGYIHFREMVAPTTA